MDLITYAINKKYTDKKVSELSQEIAELKGGGTNAETITKTGKVVVVNATLGADIGVNAETSDPVTLVQHGKNFLSLSNVLGTTEVTQDGVTYQVNADGSITLNGTAGTKAIYINFATQSKPMYLPAGEYTLGGTLPQGVNVKAIIQGIDDGTTIVSVGGDSTNKHFTLSEGMFVKGYIQVAKSTTVNHTICLQLESGIILTAYEKCTRSEITTTLPVTVAALEGKNILYTTTGETITVTMSKDNQVLDNTSGSVAVPVYWESAVASVESSITEYQCNGGVNAFTFGFITDTHSDVNDLGIFAKLMERVMDDCKIPLCLHGGDYIAGSAIISKGDLIKQHLHNDYIFRDIESRLLTAQGNHESAFGVTNNYDSNLTNAEIYNYAFRKNQGKCGIVYGDTGTYFYKDIPAQKTRYIVLDCYDFEAEMDENQVVIDNNKMRVCMFGSTQLLWLANVALDVPDESYTVIICSHNAPYRLSDLPTEWRNATTIMLDCDVTLGLINAFRNKTTYAYTGTIGSGTASDNYSIDLDFTGYKGEVACWVSGHAHMDGIFDLDGLKTVLTANCGKHVADANAPEKVMGTDTEYIMDFFCVDKAAKTVDVVRLGAALDGNRIRHITY